MKSHLDHSLSFAHLQLLLEKFGEEEGFAIRQLELPAGMELPSGIYGPIVGDSPVTDDSVTTMVRGNRPNPSRMVKKPTRPSKTATVIYGPDAKGQTVLYTCYGGPAAPREPGDASLKTPEEIQESKDFWAVHALAIGS